MTEIKKLKYSIFCIAAICIYKKLNNKNCKKLKIYDIVDFNFYNKINTKLILLISKLLYLLFISPLLSYLIPTTLHSQQE